MTAAVAPPPEKCMNATYQFSWFKNHWDRAWSRIRKSSDVRVAALGPHESHPSLVFVAAMLAVTAALAAAAVVVFEVVR